MRTVFVLLPLLWAATAHAQLPLEPPGFCAGVTADPDDKRSKSVDTYLASEGLTDRVLQGMAIAACDRPSDKARQKQLGLWRTALIQTFGYSPELTVESLRIRLDLEKLEKDRAAACAALKDGIEESLKAKADYVALGSFLGCTEPDDLVDWFADETAEPSAVYRAAVVHHCFKPGPLNNYEEDDGTPDKGNRGYYRMTQDAWCAVDLRRLDEAAFLAELKKDERLNPTARILARETFEQLKAWGAKELATLERLGKKDPDFKAVTFDAPEAAFADWKKDYEAHQPDFDELIEVERKAHAPNRSAAKGCGTKLRAVLSRLLATRSIAGREDPLTVIWDPWGYRLARALSWCEAVEGNPTAARALSALLAGRSTGLRGPRSAAAAAAIGKVETILQERPKFVTRTGAPGHPDSEGEKPLTELELKKDTLADARGVIQTVVVKGELATVSFKKASWVDEPLDCRDTSKVERVEWATGKVLYLQSCKPGAKKTVTSQEEPITIPKEYASGLQPGQLLFFWAQAAKGKARHGLPRVGYADTSQKTAVSVLGQKFR